MKIFRELARRMRPTWPRFVCSAVERRCGHVCDLEATLMKPFTEGGTYQRAYCERHAPEGAAPIPLSARYMVTRVELRVAIPSLEGDPVLAAEAAAATLVRQLEDAGGLVVGFRILGQRASAAAPEAPPLRLELAGRAEPAADGDRPFWGPPWPQSGRGFWKGSRTG